MVTIKYNQQTLLKMSVKMILLTTNQCSKMWPLSSIEDAALKY